MNTVKLVFAPSTSTDVVSYKLSWGPDPADSKLFLLDELVTDADGNIEFVLNNIAPALDGTYTFSIVAIDDAANESEPSIIEDVSVDFLAPAAPGPISVIFM